MTLLVVDALGLICRAYYGSRTRPIRDERGRDTSAVVIVHRWLDTMKPHGLLGSRFCMAWDCDGPTWRHQECADYKAHRKPKPAELLQQIPDIAADAERLGYENWRAPGFEGDDVIATLVHGAESAIIVSADKDVLQLVSDFVEVVRPQGSVDLWERWGELEVLAHLGVAPKDVPMYLALAGDATDGIPGMKKVGPARAAAMIQGGTLEPTPDVLTALRLTTLRTDAPIERFYSEGGSIA